MEKSMEHSRLIGLLTTLPGRYAKTLFDISSDRNDTIQIINQFKMLLKFFDENEEIEHILLSSALSEGEHIAILTELCSQLKLNDLFKHFFQVLAHNGRLNQIRDIQDIIQQLYDEQENKESAEIVSAHPLTSVQQKQISEVLKSHTNGSLSLTFATNPDLLGGFYVRNKNRIMNLTFSNQLTNLTNSMKGKA